MLLVIILEKKRKSKEKISQLIRPSVTIKQNQNFKKADNVCVFETPKYVRRQQLEIIKYKKNQLNPIRVLLSQLLSGDKTLLGRHTCQPATYITQRVRSHLATVLITHYARVSSSLCIQSNSYA